MAKEFLMKKEHERKIHRRITNNKCEKAVSLSNRRNGKYMKWFWSIIAAQIIIIFKTKTGARQWGVAWFSIPGKRSGNVYQNLKCSCFLNKKVFLLELYQKELKID